MADLLRDLWEVAEDMHGAWDTGMKAGKLIVALKGDIPNYDPRVTRIREALKFAVGQPVQVVADYKYQEWVGTPLWIAGVEAVYGAAQEKYGDCTFTVSDFWPPRHNGDFTTGFLAGDLEPRKTDG